MDSERERRLNDLLVEAFDLPEAERCGFLEGACGDDEVLLAEALECISHLEEIGDFLEEPAYEAISRDESASASTADTRLARPRNPTPRPVDPERTTVLGVSPSASDVQYDELGGYRILGQIGGGGMGDIYEAEDPRLGRRIAVKVLPLMMDHPDLLRRFEREARALAAFNHPNIVTIHSVEDEGGVHFLTMELVEGETLSEVIPEDGLPLDDFFRIAVELSDALAAAHERGVTHRDLKPLNVMVTSSGRTKVLDFGIAKLSAPDLAFEGDARTEDGQVLGTVAYMAPEQLKGESSDARADLFSLGLILYEMATGEHPFGSSRGVNHLTALLEAQAVPVTQIRAQLPGRLDEIVERCLAKDPEDRFQSAAALRDELRALREKLREEEILLSSSSGMTRPTELLAPSRRPRTAVYLAGTAALVVLALTFLAVRLSRPPPPADAGGGEIGPPTALAVLFFENLRGDPQHDWLSNGITEMLVTDLSQSPGLSVLSVARLHRILKGLDALEPEVVQKVAAAARVGTVVRGTYVHVGDLLRLAITIEEPVNGDTLTSRSVEGRGEESLFALVEDLSSAVREHFAVVRPELGPDKIEDATTSSVTAWRAFSEARELYREGNREEAVERYEKALEIDPSFAMAYAELATAHRDLGHTEEGREHTLRAIELAERLPPRKRFDVEARYYGANWATLGRGIETYAVGLRVYKSPSWQNQLARSYAFFERYSEAIEEFEKLITGGTTFWGNYYGAANAYAALGEFEKGYRLLSEFTDRNPDNWLLHYSLAWHLTEWGRLEAAAAPLELAAELRPGSHFIHYNRWRQEILREDWAAAEREAERLLTFDDSFARWRGAVSLAKNALYRGDSQAALAPFDEAIAGSTGADRALARCFKAELLLAVSEAATALREAQAAQDEGREQWPELYGFYLAALAEQALGNSPAAAALEETLRERWRRQPNAVEERQRHHLAGLLALRRGDAETAVAALRQAADLLPPQGIEFSWHVFPDHVPVWTSLGEAELAAGRPNEALVWLERAAASGSEHLERPIAYVRSFYWMGRAHQELGASDEARRSFQRFLAFWADGDLDRERVEQARRGAAPP